MVAFFILKSGVVAHKILESTWALAILDLELGLD